MQRQSVSNNDKRALRINEAAALYGLSRSSLYVLMARGTLRSVKVGARRLVPRDALESLIAGGDQRAVPPLYASEIAWRPMRTMAVYAGNPVKPNTRKSKFDVRHPSNLGGNGGQRRDRRNDAEGRFEERRVGSSRCTLDAFNSRGQGRLCGRVDSPLRAGRRSRRRAGGRR